MKLSALNPRTVIALFIVLLILIMFVDKLESFLWISVVLLFVLFIIHTSITRFLRFIGMICLPTFITGLLVWLTAGNEAALDILLRLSLFFVTAYMFSSALTPTEFAVGLRWWLTPLAVIRVPVDEFIAMFSVAFRILPFVVSELSGVLRAHSARGALTVFADIHTVIQGLFSVFRTLIFSLIRESNRLATVMEARGFKVGQQYRFISQSRLGIYDVAAACTIAVFVLLIVFLET
jgi:energy-coupling factor transport system permease protein